MKPANWFEGDVQANGIKIHYYRTGGQKPPVVLNHGAGDDGLCWTRVAKALEIEYDVIMLDARGHGLSDSGMGDYTSEKRAEDIARAIQALELEKPVIGGHSLGADASLHLAAQHPALARAIFLEDPPIFLPDEPIMGGPLAEGNRNPTQIMMMFMEVFRIAPRFLCKLAAEKMMPDYPDIEINPWLDAKKCLSKDFLKSMRTMSLGISGGIPTEILEKINVPVLLIIGDREKGSIVSVEVAKTMQKTTKDLRIIHLEGANHDIRRKRFDGYISALRNFLRESYQEESVFENLA
ncbi:MAG: alpha/beta fold hydrolase [Anaerolineales bacterium]